MHSICVLELICIYIMQFERDMIIWNNKTFLKQPQIVREETPIKNFRKWYSQFYSDNSKPFTEASNSLEW